jgi:hypothetical protein
MFIDSSSIGFVQGLALASLAVGGKGGAGLGNDCRPLGSGILILLANDCNQGVSRIEAVFLRVIRIFGIC